MYVAGKRLKVVRDGQVVILKGGDPVPEAGEWKRNILEAHLKINNLMTEEQYRGMLKQQENKARARGKISAVQEEVKEAKAELVANDTVEAEVAEEKSKRRGRPAKDKKKSAE